MKQSIPIYLLRFHLYFGIGIIMGIVMSVMPFGLKNPDFRAGFESGRGIKGGSVDIIGVHTVVLLSMMMTSVAAFFDLSICQLP